MKNPPHLCLNYASSITILALSQLRESHLWEHAWCSAKKGFSAHSHIKVEPVSGFVVLTLTYISLLAKEIYITIEFISFTNCCSKASEH